MVFDLSSGNSVAVILVIKDIQGIVLMAVALMLVLGAEDPDARFPSVNAWLTVTKRQLAAVIGLVGLLLLVDAIY